MRLGGIRQRTEERARTVWVPVRLQSPAVGAVDVSWTVQAGTATAGEDFVGGAGQATFAPGQTERYVPVQVLDDRVTEGRETVLITLDRGLRRRRRGLTVDHHPGHRRQHSMTFSAA